jgi:hypothetical protein
MTTFSVFVNAEGLDGRITIDDDRSLNQLCSELATNGFLETIDVTAIRGRAPRRVDVGLMKNYVRYILPGAVQD